MPLLSRWAIRAALVYLAAGFSLGALLLANKGVGVMSAWPSILVPARLLTAHIEFLLIGWTLQLILGVAFWILPRFSRGPRRGRESLAWLALILLNLGIGLAGVVPLVVNIPLLTFIGRLFEAGAAVSFALHAWPRVKPSRA